MQPRRAQALLAAFHGSSGAQKKRHQDDTLFTTSSLASLKRCPFKAVYRHGKNAMALRLAPFNEHEVF